MMALGDTARSTVIVEYKAEIHHAKAALRELSGAQKQQAKDAIKVMEDQVKAHERQAAIDAKLVAEQIKGQDNLRRRMEDGIAAYDKAAKASAASVGGAAKMAGGWKDLTRIIADVGGAIGTVTKAIQLVEKAFNTSKAAAAAAISVWNAGGNAGPSAYVGKGPRQTARLAKLGEQIGGSYTDIGSVPRDLAKYIEDTSIDEGDFDAAIKAYKRANGSDVLRQAEEKFQKLNDERTARTQKWLDENRAKWNKIQQKAFAREESERKARNKITGDGRGGGGSKGDDGGGMVDDAREWLKAATRDNARLRLLMESALGDEAGPSIDDLMKGKDAPSKAHTTKSGNYSGTDPQAAKAPTLLERMFGTPDDIAIYNNLVGGLMDAATSGFNALVTDSESAGTAIKRVIGQTVMAEGAHMLVLALKEGAYAIADLARGNFAGAAAHGASAAKFGAGAALAGVVARGLGANEKGGWGGRPEDPKPKDSNGGGAGGGPIDRDSAPRNTNIVLGHGWDDETPRQRSARFARAQRQAASYEAAPSHLEYR